MRKIIALLFAAVLVTSATGCKKSPKSQVEVNTPPPTTPTTLPKLEAEVQDAKDVWDNVRRFTASIRQKRWQEDVGMQPTCRFRELRNSLRNIGNASARRAASINEGEYLAARKILDAVWAGGLVKAIKAGGQVDSCTEREGQSDAIYGKFALAVELYETLDSSGLDPSSIGLSEGGKEVRQMLRDGLKEELEAWRKGEGSDESRERVVKGANRFNFHLESDLGATTEEAQKLREK